MNGENPLLFKCGSKGYLNQTFTPQQIYMCGNEEGKLERKEKDLYCSISYRSLLVNQPDPSPQTFTCGAEGYTNSSYDYEDFYACGYLEGKDAKANAGTSSFTGSHSLVKFMILLMLMSYAMM